MEFPEPYHSLPVREWRKYMKAHPKSYATICVRQWLRTRRGLRLICHGNAEYSTRSDVTDPLGYKDFSGNK
jgi:hypothetical protein